MREFVIRFVESHHSRRTITAEQLKKNLGYDSIAMMNREQIEGLPVVQVVKLITLGTRPSGNCPNKTKLLAQLARQRKERSAHQSASQAMDHPRSIDLLRGSRVIGR